MCRFPCSPLRLICPQIRRGGDREHLDSDNDANLENDDIVRSGVVVVDSILDSGDDDWNSDIARFEIRP